MIFKQSSRQPTNDDSHTLLKLRMLSSLRFGVVTLLIVASGIAFSSNSLLAQIIENVELRGLKEYSEIADVWGFTNEGREYAIVCIADAGVAIVDVTDPTNPVEASWVPKPGGSDRLYHCKPYKGYAYAVMRPGPVQIIDIRDPYDAHEVGQYSTHLSEVYSIFIADDIAHLTDTDGSPSGVSHIFLDISDPLNPVELGTWHRSYHHVYARNDTVIGFVFKGDVDFLDISDPANAVRTSTFDGGSKIHSGWLNDNGTILGTDQETPGGHLKLWDITDPAAPTLLGEYETPTQSTGEVAIHHSRWYFDLIYMSYWQDGFRVVDASDPTNPVQVGAYDLYDPNTDGVLRHAWGVYPYLPSRNVLVSDRDRGLLVLDYLNDGPGLSHVPLDTVFLPATSVVGDLAVINGPDLEVNSSYVYWRSDVNPTWRRSVVESAGAYGDYFFEISPELNASQVDYYLQVSDAAGNKTRAPGLAPFLEFYTFHIVDVLIPVELVSLTTSVTNGAVAVSWSTATETENLGFHVYRCATEDGDFTQITRELIPGAGNSNEAHTYTHTDRDVEAGKTYFYKLADVDFNGNETLHGPVSATVVAAPSDYSLHAAYPNPFKATTALRYDLAEAGHVDISVYNLQGQLVRTLIAGQRQAGSHSVSWDGLGSGGQAVASGVYVYKIIAGDFIAQKKILLMR